MEKDLFYIEQSFFYGVNNGNSIHKREEVFYYDNLTFSRIFLISCNFAVVFSIRGVYKKGAIVTVYPYIIKEFSVLNAEG